VIALNPETGAKLWEFDPKLELPTALQSHLARCIRLARTARQAAQPCALRIFIGTLDARLIAWTVLRKALLRLDRTEIDLTSSVNWRDPQLSSHSAPAIFKDLVITGSSIGDNSAVTIGAASFARSDARNGKLRWTWDPLRLGLSGDASHRRGKRLVNYLSGRRARSCLHPDRQRQSDYYGGIRKATTNGATPSSPCALPPAIRLGISVVHHDPVGYDVASQPTLFAWKVEPQPLNYDQTDRFLC